MKSHSFPIPVIVAIFCEITHILANYSLKIIKKKGKLSFTDFTIPANGETQIHVRSQFT